VRHPRPGQAGPRPEDIPPIVGFPFTVDLPENEDAPDTATVDIAEMSAEQTERLRAFVRQTLRIDGMTQRR
jgi:hypothetical protein